MEARLRGEVEWQCRTLGSSDFVVCRAAQGSGRTQGEDGFAALSQASLRHEQDGETLCVVLGAGISFPSKFLQL